MGATKITTPTGEAWTVHRRWLPKRAIHWRGRPLRRKPKPGPRLDGRSDGGGRGLDALDLFGVFDAGDGARLPTP